MPLHDTTKVGGVTEACRYNDHSECRAPNCACDCHKPTVTHSNQPSNQSQVVESGPEKACPKCGVRRPFAETFCRVDGERLASLLCGMCGKGMNPEDSYCWQCGAPKGQVGAMPAKAMPDKGVIEIPTVPAIEAVEEHPTVDYSRQVLKGLQEELNVQVEQGTGEAQTVVGQPAGTQGSFKIVSAPNPNKLRTSSPTPKPRQAIRLPIKPT